MAGNIPFAYRLGAASLLVGFASMWTIGLWENPENLSQIGLLVAALMAVTSAALVLIRHAEPLDLKAPDS
jgi:uncharacterized membrane protein YiaA